MNSNELMTTGEAAKLLSISRSTVSRKYDQGLLRGKTNPITGERMISRDSILSFLRQYNMPVPDTVSEKKSVLFCTADDSLRERLGDLFAGDSRIAVTGTGTGCQALVESPKSDYALFIIDADLPDIAASEVIKTLRKSASGGYTSVVCVGIRERRGEISEWGADALILKQSFSGEEAGDQLYRILGMAKRAIPAKTDYEHQRQWPRVSTGFLVRISVYRLSSPKTRDEGEATVLDISCGGMLLSQVNVASGSLPLDPFRIVIHSEGEPLPGWKAHAQVVRLRSGDPVSMAVQFTKISEPDLKKVMDLVLARQREEGA